MRLFAFALAATALAPARATAEAPLLAFAAASLMTALEAVALEWRAAGGGPLRFSFAGSSALARQIQAGAPADLFISANAAWMDELERDGLVHATDRVDLLANRLVLIAADPAAPRVTIGPALDLAGMLGRGRLAMAFVDAVPAGIYGKAALQNLGLWAGVATRVAQADNVRAALLLTAKGATPFGIVYASDALAEPRVKTIGVFPAASHPPIVYPAAIVADSAHPARHRLLRFLQGPEAGEVFVDNGFRLVE